MADEAPQVGRLIADPAAGRDCVHVAVAPVTAGQRLWPGDHVGLDAGLAVDDPVHCPPVGVVDPFLREEVQPGQRFWLFLYPGSITGLRHVWRHPAFATAPPREVKS